MAGAEGRLPSDIEVLISEIEKSSASAHVAFVEELRNYRPVEDPNWPLPEGYRARLAPAFLAYVYARATSGKEYAAMYLEKHGLNECFAAQEIERILMHFDRLLIRDGPASRGWINAPSTEYMTRRCFGLMEAFRECRTKGDWLKDPRSKQWRSKVVWKRCDRLDPTYREKSTTMYTEEVEAEIRAQDLEEISRLKVLQKLEEQEKKESQHDPLNPSLVI